MIRILIADDHQLFREGLRRILGETPGLKVVACVESGEEAIRRTTELKPDLILMDVNMPGMGGLGAAREIHLRWPGIKIGMLTISEQEADLFAAIRLGARGYILKNAATEDLVSAIRHINAGEAVIAPAMAVKLLDEFAAAGAEKRRPDDELTQREREVLRLVAGGLSNKEIGVRLHLSPHTIKAHLSTILDKLHLRGRAEAAAWAAQHGLHLPS